MMHTDVQEPERGTAPLSRPEIETAQESQPSRRGLLLPALATAVLLWASYFPLNIGWLGWFALVPFLVLIRSPARARRLYPVSFLAGLLFYLASIQWMRVADYRMYATWIGLSIACALFFPVIVFLTRWLDRRTGLPLIVTFPAVWTALEYVRAHLFTGFPWYFLSHSQHAYLPVIQITDVTGAYGVSFLLAAANVWIFELLNYGFGFRSNPAHPHPPSPPSRARDAKKPRSGVSLVAQTSALLVAIGLVLAYGYWRLSQDQFESGTVVALIQGNLNQEIRNEGTSGVEDAIAHIKAHYGGLTDQAVSHSEKPSLIVWPETSYPYDWLETSSDLPPEAVPEWWSRDVQVCQILARQRAARWRTDLLLGMNCSVLVAENKEARFNSAVFTSASGDYAGRYDKIHCVPFGEYVPMKDWLPLMNKLAPYDFDYSVRAGENFTRFTHGGYRFGVLICYEDTDPYLARQYVRSDTGGPPADFLINISNDGWFHGTSEHEQHLAICCFRAIECRRAVARAVNMGISAVIDGNGRVVALPGPTWRESKQVPTVLTASVPIDHRTSLYASWGDWLPWSCWGLIAAGMLWGLVRRTGLR
jgi:apolipoprotein N-acyltransferase